MCFVSIYLFLLSVFTAWKIRTDQRDTTHTEINPNRAQPRAFKLARRSTRDSAPSESDRVVLSTFLQTTVQQGLLFF